MRNSDSNLCMWTARVSESVANVQETGYILGVYPDDTGRDLATVLSYLTGRTLTKEEIWTAMNMSRSAYYDQLEKGTLITADNLRAAAANLGINRADLLTRYRLIDPEEIASLAEVIGDTRRLPGPPAAGRGVTTIPAKAATVSKLRLRDDPESRV